MSKDHYVAEYMQQFIDLYDRNSDEFRKDLDQLVHMAMAAGATQEKYRIISKFENGEVMFSVSDIPDAKFQKIITSKIADTVKAML